MAYQETVKKINIIMEKVDCEKTAEYMTGILTDEHVSTWKMFEDLSSRYISANDEVRKGIDVALTILTYKNMNEITDELIKEVK